MTCEDCAPTDPRPETGREITCVGRFTVRRGGALLDVPPAARRLLAYLALRPGPRERDRIASDLWPDLPVDTGLTRVRNVLYRIGCLDDDLVRAQGATVRLAGGVDVDVRRARDVADRLLGDAAGPVAPAHVVPSDARALFGADLLPEWDDEWLEADREQFARVRVRALERLARRDLGAARYHEAERACRSVIDAEPYRETAHRLLAEVHLAEGNAVQALRQLLDFQRLLHQDLGVAPGEDVRRLADAIRGRALAPGTGAVARTGALPGPRTARSWQAEVA